MAKSRKVVLPVDRLGEVWPAHLKDVRLGCLLHPASVNSALIHTKDIVRALDGSAFRLTALFGPQHGILGHTQDNMIEWEGYEDPALRIPIFSLYGNNREPTEEMFSLIDALLVDLQDVGARYYTFIWTLFLCMKASEKYKKTVVVCDRPNPINAVDIEGPLLELDHASFVGLYPIPIRHGKTIGQLARQFRDERFPNLDLVVLDMDEYRPQMWFEETGLPWVLPSPNMPTPDTAVVYPGMCLFEATNVSEGRGTTRPFELFGAPSINARRMCEHLASLKLPGVFFREAHFQPTFNKWTGQMCHGAQIHVLDRGSFRSLDAAIAILHYLFHAYPNDFRWKEPPYEYEYNKMPIDILLGNGWFRKKHIES